ncbi:OPA3-like protein [Triticum urartu]|nr:OPA3-like protein [Triticum urartu]XP_048574111.1 OPA3-like protein [Triticum urartu]
MAMVVGCVPPPPMNREEQDVGYPQAQPWWSTRGRERAWVASVDEANHRLATNMQRQLIGRATDIHIRPLNEEKAIQAATDLLGELFIFSVACGAIIFVVHRSGNSEARKEEARNKALEEIKEKMEELEREKQMMKLRVAEVEQVTGAGGGWPWVLPRAFTSGAAQAEPEPEPAAQQPTAA